MPFSMAAAILGINDSDNPRRAAVAPQNFRKSLLLIPEIRKPREIAY